jgi:MFS family permease
MGGLGLVVLSQVTTLWLACVTIVFVNMFLMTNMTTNNTILHSVAPDNMRGRVLGVYAMDMGMMPLGGVIVGLIADKVGIDTALLIGSATGVALVTLITIWNPSFKRLKI